MIGLGEMELFVRTDGLLKHDVVMLNFFPNLADTDYSNNHEFIFVIDRSGPHQIT